MPAHRRTESIRLSTAICTTHNDLSSSQPETAAQQEKQMEIESLARQSISFRDWSPLQTVWDGVVVGGVLLSICCYYLLKQFNRNRFGSPQFPTFLSVDRFKGNKEIKKDHFMTAFFVWEICFHGHLIA